MKWHPAIVQFAKLHVYISLLSCLPEWIHQPAIGKNPFWLYSSGSGTYWCIAGFDWAFQEYPGTWSVITPVHPINGWDETQVFSKRTGSLVGFVDLSSANRDVEWLLAKKPQIWPMGGWQTKGLCSWLQQHSSHRLQLQLLINPAWICQVNWSCRRYC